MDNSTVCFGSTVAHVFLAQMCIRDRHYPLVRKTIQKVLGSGVAVFDGGAGTARETLHKLKEYSLVSDARCV